MNINIRKAEQNDLETIANFNIDMAIETEGKILPKEKIIPGVQSILNNSYHGFYLMAEKDGIVAGSLMVTTEWSDWRNGLFWWIQSVYVLPQFRRQGIYKKLYKYVQNLAKAEDNVCGFRLYVEKDNKIAGKTYEDLGMEKTNYRLYEELK